MVRAGRASAQPFQIGIARRGPFPAVASGRLPAAASSHPAGEQPRDGAGGIPVRLPAGRVPAPAAQVGAAPGRAAGERIGMRPARPRPSRRSSWRAAPRRGLRGAARRRQPAACGRPPRASPVRRGMRGRPAARGPALRGDTARAAAPVAGKAARGAPRALRSPGLAARPRRARARGRAFCRGGVLRGSRSPRRSFPRAARRAASPPRRRRARTAPRPPRQAPRGTATGASARTTASRCRPRGPRPARPARGVCSVRELADAGASGHHARGSFMLMGRHSGASRAAFFLGGQKAAGDCALFLLAVRPRAPRPAPAAGSATLALTGSRRRITSAARPRPTGRRRAGGQRAGGRGRPARREFRHGGARRARRGPTLLQILVGGCQ